VSDQEQQDEVVDEVKQRFEAAGFRLLVLQVTDAPSDLACRGLGNGSADRKRRHRRPLLRSARAAAEAAEHAYRSTGRIE
jgi:hypothetical protein